MKTLIFILVYILLAAVTYAVTKGEKYYSILYALFWPITWIVELGFLFVFIVWEDLKRVILDIIYGKEKYFYNPQIGEPGKKYMATVYRYRPGRRPVPCMSYSDWNYSWVLLKARVYVDAANKKSEIRRRRRSAVD